MLQLERFRDTRGITLVRIHTCVGACPCACTGARLLFIDIEILTHPNLIHRFKLLAFHLTIVVNNHSTLLQHYFNNRRENPAWGNM